MQNEYIKYITSQRIKDKESYWIQIMKENDIFYRNLELKEKQELRKKKLNKLNENR